MRSHWTGRALNPKRLVSLQGQERKPEAAPGEDQGRPRLADGRRKLGAARDGLSKASEARGPAGTLTPDFSSGLCDDN